MEKGPQSEFQHPVGLILGPADGAHGLLGQAHAGVEERVVGHREAEALRITFADAPDLQP